MPNVAFYLNVESETSRYCHANGASLDTRRLESATCEPFAAEAISWGITILCASRHPLHGGANFAWLVVPARCGVVSAASRVFGEAHTARALARLGALASWRHRSEDFLVGTAFLEASRVFDACSMNQKTVRSLWMSIEQP